MFGYQMAVGLVLASIVLLLEKILNFDAGSSSSYVSAILGANLYAFRKEKKSPGALKNCSHGISVANSIIQLAVALPIVLGMIVLRSMAEYGTEYPFDYRGILFVCGFTAIIGLPLGYALARVGIWSGTRQAKKEAIQPDRHPQHYVLG